MKRVRIEKSLLANRSGVSLIKSHMGRPYQSGCILRSASFCGTDAGRYERNSTASSKTGSLNRPNADPVAKYQADCLLVFSNA